MIVLAVDAATDRLSVAAQGASLGEPEERHVIGARGHARALIPLVEEVVRAVGGSPATIARIILADGPGSFTGLRVATAFAKALARAGRASLATAPSLMARARRAAPPGPGLVLAAASALRGEVYAGWYRFGADGQVAVVREAMAMSFETIVEGPRPDHVAGDGPGGLLEDLARHWRVPLALREEGHADARALLLLAQDGAVREVADPATFEPTYGRPAEAQAKWEREHGRPLPHS